MPKKSRLGRILTRPYVWFPMTFVFLFFCCRQVSLVISTMDMMSLETASALTDGSLTDEERLFCSKNPKVTTIFNRTDKPDTPFRGCFVSAIFALSKDQGDKPLNVSYWLEKYPNYAFLMFTNLVDLELKPFGWKKVLHFDTGKKRMITQSRHPKFMAWKEKYIQKYCPVVFYIDASSQPNMSFVELENLTEKVLHSQVGLAQTPHSIFDGELSAILRSRKDIKKNIEATRLWVMAQPDFSLWDKRVYRNTWFAYNPKSKHYQEVSQFFWNVYAEEQQSWRDQPLWGYALHHFGKKPLELARSSFSDIVRHQGGRLGKHIYDENTGNEAQWFLCSVRSTVCAPKAELSRITADENGKFFEGKRFIVNPDSCSDGIASAVSNAFTRVYGSNKWSGVPVASLTQYYNNANWPPTFQKSASGRGSTLGKATEVSLDILRQLIREHKITSMVDMPCGDGMWIFDSVETDHMPVYIGLDVADIVVKTNQRRFEYHTNKLFRQWDGAACPLPKFKEIDDEGYSGTGYKAVELVHSRDVLQHLPQELGMKFACNIITSGARFWVTTTYPGEVNRNISPGGWYKNNLETAPFDLPRTLSGVSCKPTHPEIEPDDTCVYDLTADWVAVWTKSHCKL